MSKIRHEADKSFQYINNVIKGHVCEHPPCTFYSLLLVCLIHKALDFQEMCTVDTQDRVVQTIGLQVYL